MVCVAVQPLLDRVAATLPTPHGQMSISMNAARGTHVLRIPAGVELTGLSLPLDIKCSSGSASIALADERSHTGSLTVVPTFVAVRVPWQSGGGLFDYYLQLDVTDLGHLSNTSQQR